MGMVYMGGPARRKEMLQTQEEKSTSLENTAIYGRITHAA